MASPKGNDIAVPNNTESRVVTNAARSWLWGLVGLLALLAAYARVWRADFNWDDDLHITHNPVIIGPLGLAEIWTSAKANYFPLTMTSFWVQHVLWGLSPGPFHAVTLLFHIGGAFLLWQVLRQLEVPAAWLGAMLWALHPVQVESVAWICELKNTQSAVFFLAAIVCWLRWLEVGRVSDPSLQRSGAAEGGPKTHSAV